MITKGLRSANSESCPSPHLGGSSLDCILPNWFLLKYIVRI